MRKKALLLSAAILSCFLAMGIDRSVAQLREAATNRPVAKVITGPRRESIRRRVNSPAVVRERAPQITEHLLSLINGQGMQDRHRQLSLAILGMLDPSCQEKLDTFSVMYNNPKHRGLAGNGVIIVSGKVPDQEFIGLLLHEGLGHFRDITCLKGKKSSGASAFKDGNTVIYNDDPSVAFYEISWLSDKQIRPDARPEDFVTGYALKSDNFEDVAEALTYYMTQEEAFRERAKNNAALARKLAWLERYMPKTRTIGNGRPWDGTIAWDATKLGFTMGN